MNKGLILSLFCLVLIILVNSGYFLLFQGETIILQVIGLILGPGLTGWFIGKYVLQLEDKE